MFRLKAFFIFLTLLSSALFALETPTIKLHDSKLKSVKLSSMHVKSQVVGNIATSIYELSFYNPNAQIIEGELNFALLDGMRVIDYALEINGKYREASVVPKAKAKEAFEDVVRQNIDPALLEKTVGNNFKTRLYPIPASGYKKIKITIQELLPSKEGKSHYTMPFVSHHQLDSFSLKINLQALNEQSPVEIEGIAFDKGSQGKSFEFEKSDFRIKEPISIAFDKPKELTTFAQTINNTRFYMSTLPFNFTPKPKTAPNQVAILYNTSFSNKDRDIDKELAFLKEYLFSIKNRKVEVIFFSNDLLQRKIVDINNQGFKALAKVLRGATYDGTNNFAKLNLSKIKADEVLLFSNGIKTLYSGNIQKINKPIIAINASLKADTGVLKKYAKLSNGSFIDLMQTKPKEVIERLQNTQPTISITKTKGIKKGESFVEYANGLITLITRSKSRNATLILTINDGNQSIDKTITFKDTLQVDAHLPTLWASKRIEELSFEYNRNRKTIDKLAKYYKVLTKDMSMIVLDRVSDYVEHEITPPQELRQEYKKLLAKKHNAKLYEKEQALIESIQLIEEQKKWYAKKFPKTKRPEEKFDSEEEGEQGGDIAPSIPVEMAEEPAPAPREERSRVADDMPKAKKASKKDKPKPQPKKLEIALKSFDPDTVYLKKLKELKKHQWLHAYQMMKSEYLSQPMYYVDVASFLYKKKMKGNAIRILSNVLELDFDNSEFLRIFAYKAMEMNQYSLAIKAYERVKDLRPFEPQSYRDLALAYSKAKQYRKAVKNLYHILTHTWSGRFNGIKIVVLNEMNAIIAKHRVSTKGIDRRLIVKMPVDLRVVINWSGDNSDMDLWVTDPHGEKTFYSNKLSYIGGKISNDITGGYGPEEFIIKDAIKGEYKIEVNYYGNSQQKTTIPVTIRAEVYTHYGKKAQKGNDIVVRVGNQSKVVEIGEIKY